MTSDPRRGDRRSQRWSPTAILIVEKGVMKVLIATASRHGSADEVGERIASAVQQGVPSAEVVAVDIGDVGKLANYSDVNSYDAVVLGSAVYFGHWLDTATHFAERHADELRARPVWLFSVGPLGKENEPGGDHGVDQEKIDKIVRSTGAREHVVFTGSLDHHDLSLTERAVAAITHAPEGDFRDWESIEAYGRRIADELLKPVTES